VEKLKFKTKKPAMAYGLWILYVIEFIVLKFVECDFQHLHL
jgi:hypothetical protein